MKYKSLLGVIIISVLFIGCGVTRYNEPFPSEKSALLIIEQQNPLMKLGQPYALVTNVTIDGKYIDMYKFPSMKVKVLEGKHTISIELSAYYFNRAKNNTTKDYIIDFNANEIYKISSSTVSQKLENMTDDVMGSYRIIGKTVLTDGNILLKDSAMRSLSGNQEEVTREITDAVIQSVVIPML